MQDFGNWGEQQIILVTSNYQYTPVIWLIIWWLAHKCMLTCMKRDGYFHSAVERTGTVSKTFPKKTGSYYSLISEF